ncbi:MAG: pyridoxal phosphate-dependent aminotransferase [Methanosarcinaceae archaeon]|nr:pyridoxal phosphate-dependent aminotransferase [Methanosarcinaceae archaeon]
MKKRKKATDNIRPFYVMEILERAKEIENEMKCGKTFPFDTVIHLEVGEPDFPSHENVKKSAVDSIMAGNEKYTHSLGNLNLRKEISNDYRKRYGIDIKPERIIIGSGTSPLLLCLFMYLLEKDDEVILMKPYYSGYPNFIYALNAKPVFSETDTLNGFEPDINDITGKISKKTKGILLNNPGNPTGHVLSGDFLKEISKVSKIYKIPIISDEIYQGILYDGIKSETILKYTDDAYVLNGFSKYYNMTGWRLGYMIVPEKSVRSIQNLMQNFFISANAFVQEAGIAALKSPESERIDIVKTYEKRRNFMVEKLKETGFKIPKIPSGAFYIFADATDFTDDSLKFVNEILEKTGVACTPGIDFGQEGFIRFSYANSMENIKEAMNRLSKFIKNY